jgi:iron complex outermembrane receptor protein
VSRSFEPPLLLELNSLTVPGFVDVEGQNAWQFELGVRGRSGPLAWDVAAYDVELDNEILNVNVQPFPGAPFTVPTYRNTPRSRHTGLETGVEYELPGGIFRTGGDPDGATMRVSYTVARYRFVDDPEFGDNEIPGAPEHYLQAELRYRHPSGLSLTPKVEWVPGSYFINSANTAGNEGWTTVGLRAEYELERLGLTMFAAGNNLTDERYSASVQVDNAAGRSFEPADGRSFYMGLRWNR